MGWENIRVSREELFEKIWSQPMIKVAREYGISDVGLAKICKKLNVPRPPQGYWARKRQGRRPALPPTKGEGEHVIHKWVEPEIELDSSQKSEREILIDQEKSPENHIQVTERTEDLHRLIQSTRTRLINAASKKSVSEQSWVTGGINALAIRVSPALIDRAIQIMDALIAALVKRKHFIKIDDGRTWVTILGEKFWLSLDELSTRIDHVPTQQEFKDMKEHPWMKPPAYDYIPSGKLSLKINKDSYGSKRSWNDGKNRRIEDCLNAVIVALIDAAFKEKGRRAEREREERARKEYQRLRQQKQEEIRQEKARLSQLETQAENWHRSQKLRAFIEAVRLSHQNADTVSAVELSEWVDWATRQADRLDPLVESPPSVLDEEDKFPEYRHW